MKIWLKTEYKVPFIYLILGLLWIIFSDILLFNNLNFSPETAKIISMFKGIIFISLTTFIIYFLIKNDVNKIRQINNDLNISNDYYYSLFKNNHMASLLLDPETMQITDANQAALNLYGYSSDDIIRLSLYELSITPVVNEYISTTYKSPRFISQIYRKSSHKTSTDKIIEVEMYMGPMKIHDKLSLLTVINDISEKTMTENALKDSEQKYKKLVENIPDVFYVLSKKKGLLYISPQIKPLIGYHPSEQNTLSDIILNHVHEEDKSKFLSGRKNLFDTFEPFENSYRIIDNEKNTKWILDRVFLVVPLKDDIIVEGVLSDNTEKRKLVEELVLAHSKANESLKLKNVILSNLNHELRTPLNGIIGFSNLILKIADEDRLIEYSNLVLNSAGKVNSKILNGFLHKLESYTDINEYVELVLESAYRLNSTLNGLLTLNEIEAGHRNLYFEEASIKEYLNFVYSSNSKMVIGKNLELKIDIRDDIKFFTDVGILSQVFFNLIENAVKFTDFGTITLKGEFITKGGMWIRLSVIDTGVGINQEYYKEIFEPFRQESEGISRKFDGMGIGLTICFKLVALLKGKIEVESEPGEGSNFMVYLPFKLPKDTVI